jgi:hypothetical protein
MNVPQALLGEVGAVLRLDQRGRCAVTRFVAARAVARARRIDAVELAGLDPPLPERIALR